MMNKITKKIEKKPVRILMVAPILPIIGGQPVQAARLFDKFQKEQSLEIELQPINPPFFPRLQKIKYIRTFLTSFKYIADLLFKVPRNDVIHIFSASYYSFLLATTPAVLCAKLFGKKTILNYRSGEARDHLKTWKTSVMPTIRLFDLIVAPSGYLVDVFAEYGFKVQSIFNFVNGEGYPFRERKPVRPVFLSNRNFASLYNVSCTLRAFALIQEKIPEAKIIVVGDGEEKGKLHRLAEELNLRNIEFRGPILPEKMPEIYNQADIYLNSPNIDNMPNSIIEAFSCGLPVVSTNAGGIPYIVENEKTGLLVKTDDHEALARAAIRILESDELAQNLIVSAREECIKYSWTNVREQWLETYQQLASENTVTNRGWKSENT
jgi:glycosyltransferase involved in cell wall biosynthesis